MTQPSKHTRYDHVVTVKMTDVPDGLLSSLTGNYTRDLYGRPETVMCFLAAKGREWCEANGVTIPVCQRTSALRVQADGSVQLIPRGDQNVLFGFASENDALLFRMRWT